MGESEAEMKRADGTGLLPFNCKPDEEERERLDHASAVFLLMAEEYVGIVGRERARRLFGEMGEAFGES